MKQVSIVGAGLCGTLLAIYLAKRGYSVQIFDFRDSPEMEQENASRSINLAMSCRGLSALKKIKLSKSLMPLMVPMRSRAIHLECGDILYQSFGRKDTECIYAIRRRDLHLLLFKTACKLHNVRFFFNRKLESIDFQNKKLFFETNGVIESHAYEQLFGADGANSMVREALIKNKQIQYERAFLDHGYKELSITLTPHVFDKEKLHLWPRDNFLLLGNPNLDGSITGSLFLPFKGKTSFETLTSYDHVSAFFKKEFPDVYASTPGIVEEFLAHPVGQMSSIHCAPWYDAHKTICLIGDAAHGIIPFFGQGMNAAFEDCQRLDSLLDLKQDDWGKVIPQFYHARKQNTEAVSRMSIENYYEIKDEIRSHQFNFKKKLSHLLMTRYAEKYVSKHVLVMFTNTPYRTAEKIGALQTGILEQLSEGIHSVEKVDWELAHQLIQEYNKNLAKIVKLDSKQSD